MVYVLFFARYLVGYLVWGIWAKRIGWGIWAIVNTQFLATPPPTRKTPFDRGYTTTPSLHFFKVLYLNNGVNVDDVTFGHLFL